MGNVRIQNISLRDFRRYDQLSLNDLGRITVFLGPNAVGKTSILEAIQLVSALSSLRHSSVDEMIRAGQQTGRVEARLAEGQRQLDIALTLSENKRKYTLNGKTKSITELRGMLPAVTFSPDDLELIKGGQSNRRRALDYLGTQLNANYSQIVHDFEKVLKAKNHLLKDEAPLAMIESINDVFVKVSEQLTNYRRRLFERLIPHMQRLYAEIAGTNLEKLDGAYTASPADQSIGAIHEERAAKRTIHGAHHDTISFTINSMDAQKYGSQGQLRSLVLAWKLAEVELIRELSGSLPILLLDDVMSELDEHRRAALMQYLSSDTQVFITTANADYFTSEMLQMADIIELHP